jgi:hypothetical protein
MEKPDDFSDLPPALRPTSAEFEMGIEAATAKPVTPASLDDGIRALQERIELLEVQKKSIGNQLKELKAVTTIYRRASLNKVLVGIKADLTIARQRLADYRRQSRQQN